jgi:anthranilate/para-aminobenzoate synthase component I
LFTRTNNKIEGLKVNTKTKYTFQLSYDTKETEGHTIDAEKLGDAIVSTAKALKSADKMLNGESSELGLEVKAHSEGSFVVEFVTYVNSNGINPLSILGFIASAAIPVTVISAIQQIKSRKIKLVETIADNKSKLVFNDDSQYVLPTEVAELVINKEFRQNVEKIIKAPIAGCENAKFIVKDANDENVITLTQEDSESFTAIPLNIVDEVTEETETINIRFTRVNFEGALGWKVKHRDEQAYSATMKDEAFLERINKNKENFSKGDLFAVKLKITKTHRHGTSPRYKREVIEVLRNRTESGRKLTAN